MAALDCPHLSFLCRIKRSFLEGVMSWWTLRQLLFFVSGDVSISSPFQTHFPGSTSLTSSLCMYFGDCVCCGHLHFFKEKRDGWIWTLLLYPPSVTFLQAVAVELGVLVNLPPFCPEVQFSSGWVPPPRLPRRGVTWRLLQHCLPWSRAHGLPGSTGLPLLLPSSLANHLSFTFTQNPLSFWTLPSVHTII